MKNRAERRRSDRRVARREWKKHHNSHVERSINNVVIYEEGKAVGLKDINELKCKCDVQVNRFNKIDAVDCGNSRCFICHGDKYPKRLPTYQERIADKKLKEGLELLI